MHTRLRGFVALTVAASIAVFAATSHPHAQGLELEMRLDSRTTGQDFSRVICDNRQFLAANALSHRGCLSKLNEPQHRGWQDNLLAWVKQVTQREDLVFGDDQDELQFMIQAATNSMTCADKASDTADKSCEQQRKDMLRNWGG